MSDVSRESPETNDDDAMDGLLHDSKLTRTLGFGRLLVTVFVWLALTTAFIVRLLRLAPGAGALGLILFGVPAFTAWLIFPRRLAREQSLVLATLGPSCDSLGDVATLLNRPLPRRRLHEWFDFRRCRLRSMALGLADQGTRRRVFRFTTEAGGLGAPWWRRTWDLHLFHASTSTMLIWAAGGHPIMAVANSDGQSFARVAALPLADKAIRAFLSPLDPPPPDRLSDLV